MIHAVYLTSDLALARTVLPEATPRQTHLILLHFEYSPHLLVLTQMDTHCTPISETGWDLLSLIPLAEYDVTNCTDQPKRVIPSRLPRGGPPASPRVDDATGGPVSSGIPRNPGKASISRGLQDAATCSRNFLATLPQAWR